MVCDFQLLAHSVRQMTIRHSQTPPCNSLYLFMQQALDCSPVNQLLSGSAGSKGCAQLCLYESLLGPKIHFTHLTFLRVSKGVATRPNMLRRLSKGHSCPTTHRTNYIKPFTNIHRCAKGNNNGCGSQGACNPPAGEAHHGIAAARTSIAPTTLPSIALCMLNICARPDAGAASWRRGD